MTEKRQFSEDVYEKYCQQIKTTAQKFTDDEYICEDIVQECIAKVIENEDKLRTLNSSQLRAYLVKNAESISRQFVKTPFEFFSDCNEKTYEIESTEDRKIDCEIIRNSIEKLNEKDRIIIQLKYCLSLPDREIAPVLNIKENCVRMTLKRSIIKLRNNIGIPKK